jgi:GNAT superfamily N-acetyltransferase
MKSVIPAAGAILDRVLETTHPIWNGGLNRHAYRQLNTAQMRTQWARRHQRHVALVEGSELLASATRYELEGVLDGRAVQICGIGSVFTEPAHRGRGHARELVERLLDDAARDKAAMALLFGAGDAQSGWHGFESIPNPAVTLAVAEPPRRGAPMTTMRTGEERDLAAVVAMGRVRAAGFRFHLDRDVELVQYAITRKRVMAGLGAAGARQLLFFIAEEGITAAAYVVVSIEGAEWTLEECGDRDPSGARVGALLQALIAREPVERRPIIRAWLPPGFMPPQLTATARTSTAIVLTRRLGATAAPLRFGDGDALYWHSDVF